MVSTTTVPTDMGALTGEDQLIQRARTLAAMLRESRHEASDLGTYTPAVHEAFIEADFYRILQPRKYLGLELSLETWAKVMVEVCRADPGAGWCLALGTGHMVPFIAHFSESVVAEVFEQHGRFIAPHSAAPRGKAVAVPGGYRVSGTWAYSSGVPYSTHAMLTAMTTGPDGELARIVVLLPRADFRILDDWGGGQLMALNASGSNSVLVEDVFVPQERTSPFTWLHDSYDGGDLGWQWTKNPMYFGYNGINYALTLACSQIGAAKGCLDLFEQIIRTKKRIHPPQVLRYLHPDSQRAWGQAAAMVDAAENIVYAAARKSLELNERAAAGDPPSLADYERLPNMVWTAVRLSYEAGELMFRSVGSSVARVGDPLQELFLALQMQRTQATDNADNATLAAAHAHFGVEAAGGFSEMITTRTNAEPGAVDMGGKA